MSDTALKLSVDKGDDFIFSGMEIPGHITFGGKQKLHVHEFVGGARVVDAMGHSDMPLQWSGYLLGSNALARARFLDYLRSSGTPATLTWSELSYQVVVEDFSADFERSYNLPYRISLIVVKDPAHPVTPITLDSLNDALDDDMASAMSIVSNIGDPLLQTAYDDLKNELKTLPQIKTSVPDSPMSVPHFYLPTPNFHLPVPNVSLPSSGQSQTTSTLLAGFSSKLAVLQSRVNDMIGAVSPSSAVDLGARMANYAMSEQAAWLLQQPVTANETVQLRALKALADRMGLNIGMNQ